jgi:hypothetical protein
MHTSAETPSSTDRSGEGLSLPALVALGLSLVAAFCIVLAVALPAFHKGSTFTLFFQGCDSFCYSQMADAMRDARATGRPVDYFLQDDQTRFLIEKYKQTGADWVTWRQVVAPHGFHYFPLTDAVGPQYPPGAPWALSLFPRHGAIHALNRASIVLISLIGLAFAVWCIRRRLPLSCLVMALATYTFLYVFTWVDLASFSINATVLPLFAGIILAWMARERTRGVTALLLALAGGVGVGVAVEDRLASVLLVATMLLFFLPRRFGLIAAHAAGIVLGGIAPVLTHDKLVAGSYFRTTYDSNDTQQWLSCIWTNFLFYCHWWFQTSIVQVVLLACALAGFAVWLRCSTRTPSGHWRRWRWDHAGLILAAPSAFLLCAAFFLTHVVKEGYYLAPSMLTVALTTALLFVSLEIEWRMIDPAAVRRAMFCWIVAGLAIAGGGAAIGLSLANIPDGNWGAPYPANEPIVDFQVPEEMQDLHAWIWADMFSGADRYYTGHPAFRNYAVSPEMRKTMYGWIKARGERQYMIQDSDTMQRLIDEARADGWKTTLVGYIHGSPCFRMDSAP